MGLLNDPQLEALLNRLHAQSTDQNEAVVSYFMRKASEGTLDWNAFDEETHRFMSDKLIALDRDKAELCYQLCRALRAKRVVEAGTSFGVSTLYLAAAVRDNLRRDGGAGLVIGTEHEPDKAQAARAHFAESGLAGLIELREGDLRQTLKDVGAPVDFMLIDIWTPMARPALELVAPALRRGAVVVCDNVGHFPKSFVDYLDFVRRPANGFVSTLLPLRGGTELSVNT